MSSSRNNWKKVAVSVAALLWAGCESDNSTSVEQTAQNGDSNKQDSLQIDLPIAEALYGVIAYDPEPKPIIKLCFRDTVFNEEQRTRVIQNICEGETTTTIDSVDYANLKHYVNGKLVSPADDCVKYNAMALTKESEGDGSGDIEGGEAKDSTTIYIDSTLSCEENLDRIREALDSLYNTADSATVKKLETFQDSLSNECEVQYPLYGIFTPPVQPAITESYSCEVFNNAVISESYYNKLLNEYNKKDEE